MIERLTIARIGHRGDGEADTPAGPVYVPYALPGETVTVEAIPGHPDRRRLLRVESESAERVAPVCPHFGACGGCAVQHWRWESYCAWKRERAVRALALAGLDAPVDALVDAHGEGRRRAVLHARSGTRGILQVGFAAPRAHHVVAIDRCPVLAPGLARAIPVAWRLAEALQPIRKPLDLQFTAAAAGLDVDVRGSGPLPPPKRTELAALAASLRLARLTRHGELIAQSSVPTVSMGRAEVALPPGAFLQATAEGEAALARLVTEHATGARRIADLFCGVGPFALRLAENARVSAFDSDAAAVAALARAAAATPGLKPVAASARDLFRRPLMAAELAGFDAVVLDPPRQGAQAQAKELAGARVPRVVSVACDPATFARDAKILADGGYRPVRVTPIDQFRYSPHVELVGLFVR